jgi:hypothetical protein
MAKEIDLSSLDLRYEGHRMKNPGLEERLLVSIAQRGIEEPLEGVQREQANILLNGFKRYRCAHKLQLRSVPYRLSAQARGATPQSRGQPSLPALLQTALPEVLPLLQSLPDEVLSS